VTLQPRLAPLALAALAALAACAAPRPTAAPPSQAAALAARPAPPSGLDLTAMDPPGDDFYGFANGAWMATATIPEDRAFSGAILGVLDTVTARNRALLEAAAAAPAPAGSEARQVGDLYASLLDEAAIEARGLAPVRPALERLAALKDRRALAAELGAELRADVDALNATNLWTDRVLGLWVEQDLTDPARAVPYLLQGGLGMPDRSYYLDDSPELVTIRERYREHLGVVFRLLGEDEAAARAKAGVVLEFETTLARAHASRTDSMDVQKANNHWRRAELEANAPGLDWAAFLGAAGLGQQPGFIVWHPTAVIGLAAAVRDAPLDAWRTYLQLRAVERAAPLLPKALADEHFAFYGRTLDGTTQQLPRWKRASAWVDGALGEAVGKLYVARHFPPEAKRELEGMVARIAAAFGRRVDALGWMAPATRAQAKAKLGTLRVGIAYPDAWRDYRGLEIRRDDPVGNLERAEAFEYRRNLAKLGHPIDRGEWVMLPQTVNAVNLPVRNSLNFPAGYLEPPFYDRAATAAVKYGSIGATIGHEISHSFDDQGSQFDAQGRLASWWTPEDLAHFEAAGALLVAQFSAYRPFPDLAVNGQLTLSENLADLAGLAAAYDAWRDSLGGAEAPVVDGLTGDQQFFLAYAQGYRLKEREESARRAILTDGHAPDRYRALTVRNLDAWYAAFGVAPGQALWLAPEARVRVW
jgi:putative endopeptidase